MYLSCQVTWSHLLTLKKEKSYARLHSHPVWCCFHTVDTTIIQAFTSTSFLLLFMMLRKETLGENELLKYEHMYWKWQKYSLGIISQDYIFPQFAKEGWLQAKLAPVGLQLTINAHFIYHCLGRDLGNGNIISSNVIVSRRKRKLRIVREEWFLNLMKCHRERGLKWNSERYLHVEY